MASQALLNSQADILVSIARERMSGEQLRLQHAAETAALRLQLAGQHGNALQALQVKARRGRHALSCCLLSATIKVRPRHAFCPTCQMPSPVSQS